MRKLNEQDSKRHQDLWDKLTVAQAHVEEAEKKVNDAVDVLNYKINDFNAALQEAAEFVGRMTARMDDYISEKNEEWVNTEAGENYITWKCDWEAFDDGEVDEVELIRACDFDQVQEFGNLDTEPR